MNEKPIERLNYFNGQRLQAADLKLEQDYHMRVRRWLNRSLYTSGIASGLEVRKVPGFPKVRVSPGLALDSFGREIILLDEHEEIVPGAQDDKNKPIALYFTIRYGEELLAREDACCIPGNGSLDKAAMGAPSRVLASPVFEWSRDLPHESSGKVLLAYVGLGKGCKEVNVLDTGVRRYVGAASAAKVKQYALEGFRDVNPDNEGIIRFHVRGRQPSAVSLYLRAEKFPTYFYTELGKHTHALNLGQSLQTTDASPNVIPSHKHSVNLSASSTNSAHGHGLVAYRFRLTGAFNGSGDPSQGKLAFLMWDKDNKLIVLQNGGNAGGPLVPVPYDFPNGATRDDITQQVNGGFTGGEHAHSVSGDADGTAAPFSHTHQFTTTGNATEVGGAVRADTTGVDLEFVEGLQLVFVAGTRQIPITVPVLAQLSRRIPAWENQTLGNGSGQHLFATAGTGEIRIDMLPDISIGEGEYEIHLVVPPPSAGKRNGGRIHYNLYVE